MAKIALVFPGQGSQSVGMLATMAQQYPSIINTFNEASNVLNYDLWKLVQNGPEDVLNQTENAQPALLTAGVALWRIWQECGGAKPAILAGHSLGEYTALVCAEAIAFNDAVKLVAERGRIMQASVPRGKGAMVAIVGLSADQVLTICQQASEGQILSPANYNSIGQIVIAGETDAAERAAVLAKSAGAKMAKVLAVSVPSHCDLMRDAAKQLGVILKKIVINKPKIPVIHNADVKAYDDPSSICDALTRQLYSPVRWVETVQFLQQSGITHIFECGPGKILTGLNKRIVDDNLVVNFLGLPQNLDDALNIKI